ncbi:hypothetical protein [Beijerinckia sp. L45]|uniref:hypothetical protein n=1 Tax=Beijerinckia sp. L45 TaxID=1641855 RepID=UPI00131C7D50|nr:hypothetical protein [Beijerinckia sp. L45]
MKIFFAYRSNRPIALSSQLSSLLTYIRGQSDENEYIVILADCGTDGRTPTGADLIFRGTRHDARAMKWN